MRNRIHAARVASLCVCVGPRMAEQGSSHKHGGGRAEDAGNTRMLEYIKTLKTQLDKLGKTRNRLQKKKLYSRVLYTLYRY